MTEFVKSRPITRATVIHSETVLVSMSRVHLLAVLEALDYTFSSEDRNPGAVSPVTLDVLCDVADEMESAYTDLTGKVV